MIVILWPVPMQYVFITHHIVAVYVWLPTIMQEAMDNSANCSCMSYRSVPYAINNFISCCAACQFGLLLFLLVELATLPLNVRGFIETMGREDSKVYSRAIYVTYFVWGISRTVLPIYLVYSFWAYSYPSDRNHDICLYPNLVGAHVIALFCVGVFIFVHTPEILERRRARHKAAAESGATEPVSVVAKSLSVRVLSARNDVPVVDDSYDDIELGVLPRSARAFT